MNDINTGDLVMKDGLVGVVLSRTSWGTWKIYYADGKVSYNETHITKKLKENLLTAGQK